MLVFWGFRGKVLEVGAQPVQGCQVCQAATPHRLTLTYQYAHLCFVFRVVNRKAYWLVCAGCEKGWRVDTARAEAALGRDPIPRFDRWGGAYFLAAFLVLLAVVLGVT
jgi:hypothetical protein